VTEYVTLPGLGAKVEVDTRSDDTQRQVVKLGGNPTGTESNVNSSATSVSILAANADRIGAAVFNDSTATLYLRLSDSAASTTAFTQKMAPYSTYEVLANYTGAITGIWDSATGAARVTEIT
jgi:hypothetical protein